MKSFVLAMVAMVVIAVVAHEGLERFEMSAEQVNQTSNVRLH